MRVKPNNNAPEKPSAVKTAVPDAKTPEATAVPADPAARAALLRQMKQGARAAGIIGIAKKAGKLTVGTELTADAVRAGRVGRCPAAVFYAQDVSQGTKKRIHNFCRYYEIPLYALSLGVDALGKAVGKSGAVACIGVTDEGLAAAVRAKASVN